jgi:hypothetical protein
MNEREVREQVRELMEAGALPPTLADSSLDPQLSYYYPGSRILRFHAYCDLLWQEERAR